MNETSTLIELINASEIAPDVAHPYFVKLVKAQPHLFVNKYFVMPLISHPTIKIISENFFKNNGEVDHHIDITTNLPEYLLVTTEKSGLLVGMRTETITFSHRFKNGQDYTLTYFDDRVNLNITVEEAAGQLNQFFDEIANPHRTMRSVS